MSVSQAQTQRFWLISLSRLLYIFFISVAVIPVFFLGAWVQQNSLKAEEQLVHEKHLLLAKNLSGALSRYIFDLKATFLSQASFTSHPCSQDIQQLLQGFHVKAIVLVDGKTSQFCFGSSSVLPATGMMALEKERKEAFRRPQEIVFSPIFLSLEGEKMFYLLIVNDSNQLVMGAVSTEYVKEVQTAISFGKLGHAAIVDQMGQVMAHPLPAWEKEGKNISHLKPVKAMLKGDTGVTKFYSPALKADMIAGYTALSEPRWGVMIPQPYSELEAQAWESRIAAVAISCLGLLLALILSWKLTQYILKPIQSLILASQRLAAGEAFESMPLRRKILPKEIYNLLQSFEDMAKEVSLARFELERRVQERTKELVSEVDIRKQLEKKLVQQATHDALTGLPNRSLLTTRLDQQIAYAYRHKSSFALLFLDLDGFKQVNDTYGHHIGDLLLVSVGQRLRNCLRQYDSIYRLGGDEFVVLLEMLPTPEIAQVISEKLLNEVTTFFLIEDNHITIGGSIGIKIVDAQTVETADRILSDADQAMYEAKKQGNRSVLFAAI